MAPTQNEWKFVKQITKKKIKTKILTKIFFFFKDCAAKIKHVSFFFFFPPPIIYKNLWPSLLFAYCTTWRLWWCADTASLHDWKQQHFCHISLQSIRTNQKPWIIPANSRECAQRCSMQSKLDTRARVGNNINNTAARRHVFFSCRISPPLSIFQGKEKKK